MNGIKIRCKGEGGCGRWSAVIDEQTLQILKRRPGVRLEPVADETREEILAHEHYLQSDRSEVPTFGAFGRNRLLYVTCSCGNRYSVSRGSTR